MDELLRDFLTESAEQLESIGTQLVRFEQDPSDARIVANIFRLVHAIKGTCGFLNLPRLERIAHAAETLIDRLRDGAAPNAAMVSLVLAAVDRIRMILLTLTEGKGEPTGDDNSLVQQIAEMADHSAPGAARSHLGAAAAFEGSIGPGPTPPERRLDTVRISVKTLEQLMALVSELVLTRNQFVDAVRGQEFETLRAPISRLSAVAGDLQQGVLAARMQPVDRLFLNLHRLVRDLAGELGKKAELAILGGSTELDRQLIEAIRDPLTQMLRNALDHGIETPDERRACGKPESGMIRITARHLAGQVAIEVADDGRGLDIPAIRERAFALGLSTRKDLAAMSDFELCRYVFAPGFTTSDRVNAVSGRGVGLDIVRANIENLGGSIALTSRAGLGVNIALRIPLTLAILPALIVRSGADVFALPQHAIEELVELNPLNEGNIIELNGVKIMEFADGAVPAAHLSNLVLSEPSPPDAPDEPMLALRMRSGAQSFAILVDGVVDVQEIVLKPLAAQLRYIELFSGCVILGDGSVALVLEPAGLGVALGLPKTRGAYVAPSRIGESADVSSKLVLFRAGGPGLKALPLETVARIKALSVNEISYAGANTLVHHEDRLIPLTSMRGRPLELVGQTKINALILQEGANRMALAVDEIVDVVEEALSFEPFGEESSLLGVAKVRGEATAVCNVFRLFDLALGAPRDEHSVLAGKRVLLFETSPTARRMVRSALRQAGCDFVEALDLESFRDRFASGSPFAIVLIGLELACANEGGALRTAIPAGLARLPVLLGLASNCGEASKARGLAAGLDGVIDMFDRSAVMLGLASQRRDAAALESAA